MLNVKITKEKIMNIDYRPRQAGKTTDLIKKADKYNGYIVTFNHDNVKRCMEIAKEIKCCINMPLTFREFIEGKYHGKGIDKFHIDNAEYLIQAMTDVPIENITMSKNEKAENVIMNIETDEYQD
jgi:hypothetical protein